MTKKLEVIYNVDKLSLIYEITPDFFTQISSDSNDIFFRASGTVFILDIKPVKQKYVVPTFILSYQSGLSKIKIGELREDIEGMITLDVDNKFLYTDMLNILYEFELKYNLKFNVIKCLDVCCDATQNLPRKLNSILHSKDCDLSRKGAKKIMTEAGNEILGKKVSLNIKTLTKTERSPQSFYYYLKPSGCKKSIMLRCYNKSKEIEDVSGKDYISKTLNFAGSIYRLEISTYWRELSMQGKRKNGWSHLYIYQHLNDKEFLSEFFRRYINRFFKLNIKGKKYTISHYLCLV